MDQDNKKAQGYGHVDLSPTEVAKRRAINTRLKNIRKLSGVTTPTAATTTKLHACRVCTKEFTSGQALGGHARIHGPKKAMMEEAMELPSKRRIINKIQPEKQRLELGLDLSSLLHGGTGLMAVNIKKTRKVKKGVSEVGSSKIELGEKEISMKPPRSYVCRDCNRSFSTYQALGGHRSGHSKANKKNRTMGILSAPSRQAAFPEETNPTGPRILDFDLNKLPRIFDFDLNELPDVEDDN